MPVIIPADLAFRRALLACNSINLLFVHVVMYVLSRIAVSVSTFLNYMYWYVYYFQSAHINDFEGGSVTGVSFDSMPQVGNKLLEVPYFQCM